jgi:hypothetical protein
MIGAGQIQLEPALLRLGWRAAPAPSASGGKRKRSIPLRQLVWEKTLAVTSLAAEGPGDMDRHTKVNGRFLQKGPGGVVRDQMTKRSQSMARRPDDLGQIEATMNLASNTACSGGYSTRPIAGPRPTSTPDRGQRAVLEAKFMLPWNFSEGAAAGNHGAAAAQYVGDCCANGRAVDHHGRWQIAGTGRSGRPPSVSISCPRRKRSSGASSRAASPLARSASSRCGRT